MQAQHDGGMRVSGDLQFMWSDPVDDCEEVEMTTKYVKVIEGAQKAVILLKKNLRKRLKKCESDMWRANRDIEEYRQMRRNRIF